MSRTPRLITLTIAALALAGCSGGPAATASGPDPKESCHSFEAATNSFIDGLGKPGGVAAEKALTSMNEAAAYAAGDVQKAMGEAMLSLPPALADLGTPEGRAEAKTVNDGLHLAAEACKAAGAEINLHIIQTS
jgi:hypothetical protein